MTATTEPSRVTAGDTIAWTKALPDYPASAGWVLNYRLINAAGKIDISSAATGDDHAVAITASASAAWHAGIYTYQATVEKAGERYTVATGKLSVAPNLANQAAGFDTRSPAQAILDNLLAAYQSASAARAFVQEYEIAGRRMKFNSKAEWLLEINFWKREVAAEERAARRATGLSGGTRVYERF